MRWLAVVLLVAIPTFAFAQQALVKPSFEVQRVKLLNAAQPPVRTKIDPIIKQMVVRADAKPAKPTDPPIDLVAETNAAISRTFPNLPAGDIEALAMLVLMQASKQADDDLRDMMSQMQKLNAEKQAQREALEAMKREIAKRKERSDALQKAVSSILKKYSDTSAGIVQNIK